MLNKQRPQTRYNSVTSLRVAYFWKKTRVKVLLKLVFFAALILRMLCSTFAMLFMAALLLSSSIYREIVRKNNISVPRIAGGFDDSWN